MKEILTNARKLWKSYSMNKFVLKIKLLAKLNDKLCIFLHFKLIKQIIEGLGIKKTVRAVKCKISNLLAILLKVMTFCFIFILYNIIIRFNECTENISCVPKTKILGGYLPKRGININVLFYPTIFLQVLWKKGLCQTWGGRWFIFTSV